jgi:hypothetical protein
MSTMYPLPEVILWRAKARFIAWGISVVSNEGSTRYTPPLLRPISCFSLRGLFRTVPSTSFLSDICLSVRCSNGLQILCNTMFSITKQAPEGKFRKESRSTISDPSSLPICKTGSHYALEAIAAMTKVRV